MGPRNKQVDDNSTMNAVFYVQDYTSSVKGAASRKCNVHFSTSGSDGLAKLEIEYLESTNTKQVYNETKVLKPNEWLVYLPQTIGHTVSLVLMKSTNPAECVVFEARSENIPVLKMMEAKMREFLRVILYHIKVKDKTSKDKPNVGTLHIMRDRLMIITGAPPNTCALLDYTFAPFKNGITFSPNNELGFDALPDIAVLSDQTHDIWRTIHGCMQTIGLFNKTSTTEDFGNKCDEAGSQKRLLPQAKEPTFQIFDPMNCESSSRTMYVYYNLPKNPSVLRPCKYVYMNLPDRKKAPVLNHQYVNVRHVGSVYQNCWRSCTKKTGKDSIETGEVPPPPPPRLKPPPLPPKPRNRPPNSPLPPIPTPDLPPQRRLPEPPSLPLPRLPERYVHKEIQYVVYSSKPVSGQIFVIQVVFFQKHDDATLERIKKLEEEANYQVLKPLPDCISVSGDLKISLLDIDACCTLKSEKDQVIEHEIVKEAILQSCWVIIEFHLEHNENTSQNFHAKIAMQPKTGSNSRSSRTNKDIQISTTFQMRDAISNVFQSSQPVVCNSLKTIGVRKYLEVCGLMDIPCALHNDWTGLAGEIGLTVDEVFRIQSKACFPNFSPTNEVLNIWSQRQNKSCNIDGFKAKLENLQRFDVLEVLKGSE
ncbi:uncharacterized protein LOC114519263 isoform X2 [Dendronephthya gigantea]|uniref:uncharacterized protein LOC114519263 isoform X2 n=1 Tax=Dendronephthya gigantea TaxID=151771 RepID=UPI00106CAA88|nr:uncharacterized protein LOC114519263 isoform X2 [Dendronephthya gigantea]XP_028395169.1 uncharacterized protein LOC114519263 isoform X2 [Dendronephthya gigantea]